jgi:hypothetical protein
MVREPLTPDFFHFFVIDGMFLLFSSLSAILLFSWCALFASAFPVDLFARYSLPLCSFLFVRHFSLFASPVDLFFVLLLFLRPFRYRQDYSAGFDSEFG